MQETQIDTNHTSWLGFFMGFGRWVLQRPAVYRKIRALPEEIEVYAHYKRHPGEVAVDVVSGTFPFEIYRGFLTGKNLEVTFGEIPDRALVHIEGELQDTITIYLQMPNGHHARMQQFAMARQEEMGSFEIYAKLQKNKDVTMERYLIKDFSLTQIGDEELASQHMEA